MFLIYLISLFAVFSIHDSGFLMVFLLLDNYPNFELYRLCWLIFLISVSVGSKLVIHGDVESWHG